MNFNFNTYKRKCLKQANPTMELKFDMYLVSKTCGLYHKWYTQICNNIDLFCVEKGKASCTVKFNQKHSKLHNINWIKIKQPQFTALSWPKRLFVVVWLNELASSSRLQCTVHVVHRADGSVWWQMKCYTPSTHFFSNKSIQNSSGTFVLSTNGVSFGVEGFLWHCSA